MSPTVAVLDYGCGNVRSAVRALERVGARTELTAHRDAVLAADGLVVPGVGAFGACLTALQAVRGGELIGRRLAGSRPVLGICVGMQVLFDVVDRTGLGSDPRAGGVARSGGALGGARRTAHGVEPGVGPRRTPGCCAASRVSASTSCTPMPCVRWDLETPTDSPIAAPMVTWADHGGSFVAAVENGPLSATQFHPEKSGDAGATLLENWVRAL